MQKLAHSLPPPTSSSRRDERSQRLAYATERTRLLFGQFRKGDANDPATYVASIAAMLAQYDPETIRAATDPVLGLASRSDFLPTVREVGAMCEEIEAPRRAAAQREREAARQRSEVDEWQRRREAAPRHEELRAKGIIRDEPVTPLPAEALWRTFQEKRALYGSAVRPTAETRAILESAGYSV